MLQTAQLVSESKTPPKEERNFGKEIEDLSIGIYELRQRLINISDFLEKPTGTAVGMISEACKAETSGALVFIGDRLKSAHNGLRSCFEMVGEIEQKVSRLG